MSRCDGDKPAQYWGLVLFLVVVVLFCSLVLLGYGGDHREERGSAAAAAKYNRFLDCVFSGDSSPAQCKSKSEQTSYDQTTEAYDLKAQQEMAKWSLLMLIISGVGVGLIAVTVWQTIGVLDEAKKTTNAANRTVDETKRIGDAQVRAYIGIDAVQVEDYAKDGKPVVKFVLKNYGQSPAMNVTYDTAVYWFSGSAEVKMFFDSPRSRSVIGPIYPSHQITAETNIKFPEQFKLLPSIADLGEFHFAAYVRYRDHTRRRRRLLLHAFLRPVDIKNGRVYRLKIYKKHNTCD